MDVLEIPDVTYFTQHEKFQKFALILQKQRCALEPLKVVSQLGFLMENPGEGWEGGFLCNCTRMSGNVCFFTFSGPSCFICISWHSVSVSGLIIYYQ